MYLEALKFLKFLKTTAADRAVSRKKYDLKLNLSSPLPATNIPRTKKGTWQTGRQHPKYVARPSIFYHCDIRMISPYRVSATAKS
jgi:hypothetical protein